MTKKKRTPEEIERRAKIRELLQVSNIGSMADIQNLFKETIAEFMENSLDAELDDELGYSTTIKPVRRTFPNSTIHIVSNTWEGSFLPLPRTAGAKIPLRATQSDSAGAAPAFRKLLNTQSAAGNARFLQPFVA